MATSSEQRTFKVFISYRRDDDSFHSLTKIAQAAVDHCNEEMPNVHLECFIDRQGIRPGSDWRRTIDRNLVDTDILLAFITEDYCRSEECRYEFNTFPTDRRHIFLPVFWHSPEVIESSLNSGQDDQDAHAVFAEACRRNGISTIAPDVEQMFRDDFGDPVFELRQKIIVLNIAKVVKRLSQYLDSRLTAGAFSDSVAAPTAAPNDTNQSSPVFHVRGKRSGIDAQAQLIDGVFTVLQGSIIAANLSVKSGTKLESAPITKAMQKMYDRHYADGALITRDDGRTALVTRDIQFTSPSSASAFVKGHATDNGQTSWKTDDDTTYGDWFKTISNASGEETA